MTKTTTADAAQVAVMGGDVVGVSDCCLAPVESRTEQTHPEHDWHSVSFICTKCGKECAQHTNPRIIELERENRKLRAQVEK